MSKRLEHVEAAKEEAARLGVDIELGYCAKHITGTLKINGQQRKVFMSKTTANGSVCHIVRMDVRRKVQEMMNG